MRANLANIRPLACGNPHSGRALARLLLIGVALLAPRVGHVVVAAVLPEAAPVLQEVFDRAHPFDALPPVQVGDDEPDRGAVVRGDRKSTRLNSSHVKISYAVFCL